MESASLDSNLLNAIRTQIINEATKTVGIKEHGYNRGKEVEIIINDGGGLAGYSWCMYSVCYDYKKGFSFFDLKSPLLKTGSVCRQLQYCNSIGSKFEIFFVKDIIGFEYKSKKADIFIMKSGSTWKKKVDLKRYWKGHTGEIISNQKKILKTIEGNTNNSGSREGDGKYFKKRDLIKNNIVAIIRYKG